MHFEGSISPCWFKGRPSELWCRLLKPGELTLTPSNWAKNKAAKEKKNRMFQVFRGGGSELCDNSCLQEDHLSIPVEYSRRGSSDHRDINSVRLPKRAEPSETAPARALTQFLVPAARFQPSLLGCFSQSCSCWTRPPRGWTRTRPHAGESMGMHRQSRQGSRTNFSWQLWATRPDLPSHKTTGMQSRHHAGGRDHPS